MLAQLHNGLITVAGQERRHEVSYARLVPSLERLASAHGVGPGLNVAYIPIAYLLSMEQACVPTFMARGYDLP